MIDTSSVKNSLVTLAKKIESTDYDAAVRLRLLGDAVEGGRYAKGWGASDIYKLINPDLIVERYMSQHATARGWLVEVLELARNVFIFVPIIITWLGISQATSKYHELLSQCLNKCPDQVSQPFLYLWEQGFGGRLPDVLRLSNVGLIDATILAIIFTLTFIVTLLANASNREQDLRAQRLHGDLVHAIAGASLCLLDKPTLLMDYSDNLDDVAKRTQVMSHNDLARFDTLGLQIAKQFSRITKEISAQFVTIENEFSGQLQESNQYLNTLGQFVVGLNELSIEMKTAANTLRKANTELSQNLNLLVGPVIDLSKQQQGLLNAANQSVAHLENAINKLSDLDTQQKQWVGQFLDTLETLHISLDRVERIVSNSGDFNNQQKMFLSQREKEQEG
jgi:hypothetical protein